MAASHWDAPSTGPLPDELVADRYVVLKGEFDRVGTIPLNERHPDVAFDKPLGVASCER